MKTIVLVLSLFILSSFASAITVELISPPNGAQLQYDINNIQFTCKAPGAEVAKLYTNINGTWAQTGNTIYGKDIPADGKVTFTIVNVSEGTYKWNCFANQIDWASANFTYNFQFPPNEPPKCAVSFPTVTLQKNTAKTNVLNLNNYFSDPETDYLVFAFSGNNNVDITVKTDGSIDLIPKQDRIATDSIYFRASDKKNSDVQCPNPLIVTIEGGQTPAVANTTPTVLNINPSIPDQSKNEDVSYWEIDLDDYVEYSGSKSDLNWTVENVGTDVVNITINKINHEVRFEPLGVGSDNVLFVVESPGRLEDDQSVAITITSSDEENAEDAETDLEEEVESEFIKIKSHTPGSSDPIIEEGSSLNFSVDVDEVDSNIIWYVDGIQVDENGNEFTFVPEKSGKYKILVSVSKDGEEDNYEWEVNVVGSIGEEGIALVETADLCGNGEIDEGENCAVCPEDNGCEEGEECIEGACLVQSKATGFSIKGLNGGSLIGVIIAGVVLLLFIVIMLIRTSNLRKSRSKNRTLSSFEPRIKERIGPKKEEHILSKIEKEESKPPTGIEHIIGFIQSGLASGDNEKEIKKALINGGWNRKQIKQAFGSIRR